MLYFFLKMSITSRERLREVVRHNFYFMKIWPNHEICTLISSVNVVEGEFIKVRYRKIGKKFHKRVYKWDTRL